MNMQSSFWHVYLFLPISKSYGIKLTLCARVENQRLDTHDFRMQSIVVLLDCVFFNRRVIFHCCSLFSVLVRLIKVVKQRQLK